MPRRFVVLVGPPGSGKSTIAQQLAPRLQLPVFDKDDWLERAFATEGVGHAARHRRLSRQADVALQHAAARSRPIARWSQRVARR